MSPTLFEELLTYVAPLITKKDTNMRSAIGPDQRIALTLRYLATGDANTSIETSYRISPQNCW